MNISGQSVPHLAQRLGYSIKGMRPLSLRSFSHALPCSSVRPESGEHSQLSSWPPQKGQTSISHPKICSRPSFTPQSPQVARRVILPLLAPMTSRRLLLYARASDSAPARTEREPRLPSNKFFPDLPDLSRL